MSTTLKIVNGDLAISSTTGRPVTVADEVALKQGVVCNLETATRADGFGAGIQQLLGADMNDDDLAGMMLDRRIRNSFTVMKDLQNLPPTDQRPSNERLATIGVTQASRDPNDPRIYRYNVTIITEAGAAFRVGGVLTQE